MNWGVTESSSQLGGIIDVWLRQEYEAFDGFRAPPGGVAVDVGANVGAFALRQASSVGSDGVVVAAEASPSTLEILRANISSNDVDIVVVPAACWVEAGHVEFTVSDRSSSTAGVTSAADHSLIVGARVTSVPAVTLADLCTHESIGDRRIDVLKLDIEGAELDVLRSASAGDVARVARVVVEAAADVWADVRDAVEALGFTTVGRVRNVGYFSRSAT